MPRCLISFGANIGDARGTIESAAELLRHTLAAEYGRFQLSSLFNTPPVGGPSGQPPFLNAVAMLETQASPWEVWRAVRDAELHLGRERFKRWEARRIDLDILLYDDARIWTPQLKIPHPRMCMRRFILEPAAQLAADWIDPVSQRSIGALAHTLRRGRGNFELCAEPSTRGELLLEEVARLAMATWRLSPPQPVLPPAGFPESTSLSRWVRMRALPVNCSKLAALPNDDVLSEFTGDQLQADSAIHSEPKLTIFLAPENAASGAQWEDIHRGLAGRLNLVEQTRFPPWELSGPRYLLATDDPQWAIHEMAAALDAMDCPVEMT